MHKNKLLKNIFENEKKGIQKILYNLKYENLKKFYKLC